MDIEKLCEMSLISVKEFHEMCNKIKLQKEVTYALENQGKKITYVVKPVYRNSGESKRDILAKLMCDDAEKSSQNP